MVLASPGPDWAVIMRFAFSQKKASVIYCALGIATSIGLYTLAVVSGALVLFEHIPFLKTLLLLTGGCFLIFLGLSSLLAKTEKAGDQKNTHPQHHQAFITGFLTNLSNPKAFVYFTSIITPFISKNSGFGESLVIILGLSGLSFLWFSGLGLTFTHPGPVRVYERFLPVLMKVLGCLFLIFGLSFLWQALKSFFV